MNRLFNDALPQIFCALCIAVLLTPSAGLSEQMEWSLPENQQQAVRWDILSGYWVSPYYSETPSESSKYAYTSKDGLIDATKYKSHINFFAGRWKVVRRMIPGKWVDGVSLEKILVVTEERFCGAYGQHDSLDGNTPHYRQVDVFPDENGPLLLELDYSLDIAAPPNPFSADKKNMWKQFRDNAENAKAKDEGPWRKITKDQAPQWFRDLVAKDLIHDNRCVRNFG